MMLGETEVEGTIIRSVVRYLVFEILRTSIGGVPRGIGFSVAAPGTPAYDKHMHQKLSMTPTTWVLPLSIFLEILSPRHALRIAG